MTLRVIRTPMSSSDEAGILPASQKRIEERRVPWGFCNASEQSLALTRLLQEVGCARFHGLNGKAHVSMARDEDQRHGHAPPLQLLLEFKPIHLGHADVSHKAISCQATWAG